MVDISRLNNLSIYTLTGQYIGKIADVFLNMKNGTISKLRVRAIEDVDEKNIMGFRGLIGGILNPDDEEEEQRVYKKDFVTVDYSKVRAVGDIILIDASPVENPNPSVDIPLQ